MKWKLKIGIVFLTVLAALAVMPLVHASITVPSTTHFGCGSGCYISFDEQKTFTSINKTFQTSGWYFDNYGFEASNCNITVTDLFVSNDQKVLLTLRSTGESVASVKFEDGNRVSQPAEVLGGASWSYDTTDNTVTFSNSLTANTDYPIIISWYAGGGGGGSGGEEDNPNPSPSPTPPVFTFPDFTPETVSNILIIAIIVAVAVVVSIIIVYHDL